MTEQILDEGLAHHQAGRLAEAEWCYQEVLRVNPWQPDALHLLGLVHHQQGRNEAAVEHIRRAIDVQPRNEVFWANLCVVYYALGLHREAADAAEQVLRLTPNSAKGHVALGCALQALGDVEGA